jgi:hypothetical protein
METADPLVVRRVEEWFLARGVPHFIDGYSVTRDVFTRNPARPHPHPAARAAGGAGAVGVG